VVPDSNYAKTSLYPAATSQAFLYRGSYQISANIMPGGGYWLKFPASSGYMTPGEPRYTGVDSVKKDWNLVGSIGRPVLTSSVTQDPSGLVNSQYYGYSKGYFIANTLMPGKGYWVKSTGTGALHLSAPPIPKQAPSGVDFSALNRITVGDADKNEQSLYLGSEKDLKVPASMYEMPPLAPEGVFDVRFASQQMVETYPSAPEAGKVYQYAISIQTSSYPVTVSWNIRNTGGRTLTMTDGLNGRVLNNVVLNNSGSIKIADASVKTVVLKLGEGRPVPKEFALSQNYPNPFNPTTRFDVEVPKTANVEVVVYNILGQRVATLMSGMQQAGYLTIQWDGRDAHGLTVPSGMYFVRMTADQFSAVRKIMMLK